MATSSRSTSNARKAPAKPRPKSAAIKANASLADLEAETSTEDVAAFKPWKFDLGGEDGVISFAHPSAMPFHAAMSDDLSEQIANLLSEQDYLKLMRSDLTTLQVAAVMQLYKKNYGMMTPGE